MINTGRDPGELLIGPRSAPRLGHVGLRSLRRAGACIRSWIDGCAAKTCLARHVSLLAICAAVALPACRATTGRVEDGRYFAESDAFSLPVPKLSIGTSVQQGVDKGTSGEVTSGSVNFHDNFGNMRSIEYEALPQAQVSALADAARAKQFASVRFRDRYFDKLKGRVHGVRIMDEGKVTLSDGSAAWFAMIKIPAPAPIQPNKGSALERAPDATRGFLFLLRGDQYFTLSLGNDPRGILEQAGPEKPDESVRIERMKREITELYDSIHFGPFE